MSSSVALNTKFSVELTSEVLARFPETSVSVLLAKIIISPKAFGDAKKYLDGLKAKVFEQVYNEGLRSNNYQEQSVCKAWKEVFKTFEVEEDKVSTIENILKRSAIQCDKKQAHVDSGSKKQFKPDVTPISNFVDFYNLISLETKTPMGALDLEKIDGPIQLRMGREGETFTPLGKTDETIPVKPSHIVYADDKSVLTWLWNYRDAKHCCVPDSSGDKEAYILLFADQATKESGNAESAIKAAAEGLPNIGGKCLYTGTLTAEKPSLAVEIRQEQNGEDLIQELGDLTI